MVANDGALPRGSAAATASMHRRRTASAGSGGVKTMLQFYTDDKTGAKIAPNTILIMSTGFIAFVAILHVLGKFYCVPRAQ